MNGNKSLLFNPYFEFCNLYDLHRLYPIDTTVKLVYPLNSFQDKKKCEFCIIRECLSRL